MSQKINKFYQNYFIELALKLAKINEYKTGENPSVGCVLTNFNNEILSTGITSVDGRPHAESNALDKILKNKNNKKKKTICNSRAMLALRPNTTVCTSYKR